MALAGAFAAGVAAGVAGIGAACLARRVLRDRRGGGWRDDGGGTPHHEGGSRTAQDLPPVGQAPIV